LFFFPSFISQSPKLFQLQARTPLAPAKEGDEEMDPSISESDEDSSDEDEDGGRPVPVQNMRLEAARLIRPKSASASQNAAKPKNARNTIL